MADLVYFRKYTPPLQVSRPPHWETIELLPPVIQSEVTVINSPKNSSDGGFHYPQPPINLKWNNITFTTNNGTLALKGLSGSANGGELLAIMGPSGAGKSTLLNVLSGFSRSKVNGSITVNGAQLDMRGSQSCYVMQDDHLLPHLTVRESMDIAARLKIPTNVSRKDKDKAVEDCMEILGLKEQEGTRVNQLSGGQRKRLSIAQELVSKPHLIFLDEPTSGLDCSASLKCIQLLKSLAEQGRTVICTIHQPNARIFELFDKLYMMTEGHFIYNGATKDVIPFLSQHGLVCPTHHNPAEFLTEVASGEHGDWIEKLRMEASAIDDTNEEFISVAHESTSSESPCVVVDQDFSQMEKQTKTTSSLPKGNVLLSSYSGCATNSWNQFKVLTYRSLICTFREPMATQFRFFSQVLVGLFTGMLFYGIGNDASKIFNNCGFLFFSLFVQVYTSMMPTLLTFPLEKNILAKEHLNKWYSTRMYYLAKTSSEIPFQIIFPILYCSIVYYMSAQPNDLFRFGVFVLSNTMSSLVAQSVGFLVGAATSTQNAVFLGPIVTIPIMLFSGFFITLNKIPSYMRWLTYLSYTRFCFQSVLTSIYGFERPTLYCDKFYCWFQEPKDLLSELDMEDVNIYEDFAAMCAFFFVFRVTAYYVLCFKVIYNR